MRLISFIHAVFLFVTLSAAWPWPPSFLDVNLNKALGRRAERVERRAASTTTNASAATTGAKPTADATKAVKETGKTSNPTKTDNPKGNSKATDTKSNSGKTTSKPTKSISINPADAPGGISMITPGTTTTTYYKIGEDITMVWNYTSLLVTPSKVNVIASNTNGVWTITENMKWQEKQTIKWNTSQVTSSLAMASYSLVVYDPGNGGVTALPKAGYLSPFQQFPFAMYSPQPVVNENDFFCVTCSRASSLESQSITMLLFTTALTVLSFTYFASGFIGI